MIKEMIGPMEEKNENKYLVLDDVDGVRKEIETINGGERVEYEKDF